MKVIEEGLATVFVVQADEDMASGLNEFTYPANGRRTIVRVVKHAERNDEVERLGVARTRIDPRPGIRWTGRVLARLAWHVPPRPD